MEEVRSSVPAGQQDVGVETFVRTPAAFFLQPQRFEIPLFQRPYVWNEEDQWQPLWLDIRRVADLRLREPSRTPPPSHFLGAVVVQAQEGATGDLASRNVIDGQQRLTTLQLLMDAAAAAFDDADVAVPSSRLERLTHNESIYVAEGESRLKIRHANKDRGAFDEVMAAPAPILYEDLAHADTRIVKAHRYFSAAVRQWLLEDGEEGVFARAEVLEKVLSHGLQLVAIDLTASENSQEIFETLNARGTPLTAADLIRNYVFQRLEEEGADTKRAYREDWPFETRFWESSVSVGRYNVGRSSLFLNQWLVSRTGEEIGPPATFTRFKAYVEHESGQRMADLLPVIQAQAQRYEAWTLAAEDPDRQLGPVEMAVYRMKANGVELLKPILIWLHEPGRNLPQSAIAAVVQSMESWVMRRLLLRLPGSDLGRIVAEVIKSHARSAPEDLADRVSAHLSRLNVSSTYWPGDAEVRSALLAEPVYLRFRRARMRMILEAVEDAYRGETNQPQLDRRGHPIEHILPQKWADHWKVNGLQAEQERAAHVHRLGNLTLLTRKLNPGVSNKSWPRKRRAYLKHNTINMTGRLLLDGEDAGWDEAAIDRRTAELTDVLLRIWPVPPGHTGEVVDPQAKSQEWVELRHLIAAGLLHPGTRLAPAPVRLLDRTALVCDDARLDIDGQRFSTPSGAARGASGKTANGWTFWVLPDGRKLADVRSAFIRDKHSAAAHGTAQQG